MLTIHAFDFDGTITNSDSLICFLRHSLGPWRFWGRLLRFAPLLVAMKLRMADNGWTKQQVLASVIGGRTVDEVNSEADRFVSTHGHILRPKAMRLIGQLQQQEATQVVVVTASPELWVSRFLPGVKVIGTRLEQQHGHFTGRFVGRNCHGAEKVTRLKKQFPHRESYRLVAYGDSRGDRQLFEYADESLWKPFE